MPSRTPPPSVFAFTFDASLAPFDVAPAAWLATHGQDLHLDGLAVATVVFDDHDQRRVLLVQRAAHDSMPNLWEVPGGAADQAGDTLLRAAARELWEEAGLVCTHFARLVPQPAAAPPPLGADADATYYHSAPAFAEHPGHVFTNRTGTKTMVRFAFLAEVASCSAVVLDPEEHQAYVWATEAEVRAGVMASGQAIPATMPATQAMILEAFRLKGA